MTEVEGKQKNADHQEKRDSYSKVLCRQGLTGRCYWEVEWKGEVSIGVTYRGIARRGDDRRLGRNNKSWSLEFHDDDCTQYSDTDIPTPSGSVDGDDDDDDGGDDDGDDDDYDDFEDDIDHLNSTDIEDDEGDDNGDYDNDGDDYDIEDYDDGEEDYDDFEDDYDHLEDDDNDDDNGDDDIYDDHDQDDYDEDDYYRKTAIDYFAWHNSRETVISLPTTSYDDDDDSFRYDDEDIFGDNDGTDSESSARHNSSAGSNRVGVYLDRPAGSLSFYRVSSDTLTHIHTFQSTFTQELHPGFGFELRGSGSTVSLCRL